MTRTIETVYLTNDQYLKPKDTSERIHLISGHITHVTATSSLLSFASPGGRLAKYIANIDTGLPSGDYPLAIVKEIDIGGVKYLVQLPTAPYPIVEESSKDEYIYFAGNANALASLTILRETKESPSTQTQPTTHTPMLPTQPDRGVAWWQ